MGKIDFKQLDKKSKIEIVITSVMVIVLIIILCNSIKTILRTRGPVEPAAITPVAFREIAKRDISISAKSKQIEKAYKEAEAERVAKGAAWGRDPFAAETSLREAEWTISDLSLEGIMWDEKEPYAIINGEVVKKGDKIGKTTVVQIQKDSVIVSDGTEKSILRLW